MYLHLQLGKFTLVQVDMKESLANRRYLILSLCLGTRRVLTNELAVFAAANPVVLQITVSEWVVALEPLLRFVLCRMRLIKLIWLTFCPLPAAPLRPLKTTSTLKQKLIYHSLWPHSDLLRLVAPKQIITHTVWFESEKSSCKFFLCAQAILHFRNH